FEMLERLKKSNIPTVISEADYPSVRDVDVKLMEFARDLNATIITNDYNLNKVAKLRGIRILNINDLANTLKPVVLPGENMKVRIVKEGTEASQGVAYLDDGTMVVVDNASNQIGKTIVIGVTSVLQTAMGKMIFGRIDEPQEHGSRRNREHRS
ncbi:TRAM domain-containing protein, partial [Acidobacteriota bacterium]